MIFLSDQDNVYVGIYEIPHGLFAMVAGKLRSKPVVVNIIGNPGYSLIRKGLRKWVTYWILRNVNIITTTGSVSRRFLINEGFSPAKLFVLPNSIDVNWFIPKKNINKEYDIINIGRLSPEKRLLDFVKIIALIQKEKPDIQVAIAGMGPEKENIQKEIKHHNLTENIKLLGFVDNRGIVDFFNSGRVFVMCSETEGFPRTIIQSLSCGIPCVVSEVGDLTDLIIHGKTGFCIKSPEIHKEFAAYAIQLLNDSEIYDRISNEGLNHVRESYSHNTATQVWSNIINELSK